MRTMMLVGGIALAALSAHTSWGQERQAVIAPIEWADEYHVNYVNGDCTQSLSVPNTQTRTELDRFYISYFRSEGCLWWPLDREMEGLRAALPVLLTKVPNRARVAGLYFGRVMQPAIRLRIANAALEQHLTEIPNEGGFYKRLRSAIDAADVFKELRELFAVHGFLLSVQSLEKIERSREVEMAQQGVDPKQFIEPPPENAQIPIGAIVWFDLQQK